MGTPEGSYQSILLEELEARCAKNARYSLRAFARDIGLSAASLSLVLSGKQGLSSATAAAIARRLGMSAAEQARFRDLVLSRHARSRRERELARIRLRQSESPDETLAIDAFRAVSDWYHFAILELTQVEGFRSDPAWIARALAIPASAAKAAIDRLKRLELLEERDGQLWQTDAFLAVPGGTPSEAIKKFHSQILKKAEEALHLQLLEERDFSSLILPIDPADLAWAKEELKRFRRAFMERLERAPRKKKVYCLSMQFFGLQSNKPNKESL